MVKSKYQEGNSILNKSIKIELPELNLSPEERLRWKLFYTEKINSTSGKWLNDIWSFLLLWVSEEEVMHLKTSGSTGEPKNIEVKKSTMIFSAQQTSEYFHFKKGEKWLMCLPAAFIGGQMILVRAILNDTDVFAVEPKIDLKEVIGEFDFASMIPMQVKKYLSNKENLRIKRILIGGASVPVSLEKSIDLENDSEYFASYGMTETVSHIALRKLNGNSHSDYFTGFKNILLGTDSRGCLTIYHKNYSEDVLITNDLVEFDSHERFRVIGRVDNIINSGGLKIIPEEIELRISEVIPQRILLIGFPDEILGEKPVLLIEGIELDKSTMLILKNYLSCNLQKNHVPKEILFLNNFVETTNGKLDRNRTKDYFLNTLRNIL